MCEEWKIEELKPESMKRLESYGKDFAKNLFDLHNGQATPEQQAEMAHALMAAVVANEERIAQNRMIMDLLQTLDGEEEGGRVGHS